MASWDLASHLRRMGLVVSPRASYPNRQAAVSHMVAQLRAAEYELPLSFRGQEDRESVRESIASLLVESLEQSKRLLVQNPTINHGNSTPRYTFTNDRRFTGPISHILSRTLRVSPHTDSPASKPTSEPHPLSAFHGVSAHASEKRPAPTPRTPSAKIYLVPTSEKVSEKISEKTLERAPETASKTAPETASEKAPETASKTAPETASDTASETASAPPVVMSNAKSKSVSASPPPTFTEPVNNAATLRQSSRKRRAVNYEIFELPPTKKTLIVVSDDDEDFCEQHDSSSSEMCRR